MADEHRVTIRLPADLYAQLEASGSHGLPLAAIVCHALVDYLSRQPEPSQHPVALATTLAAMAASIEDLRSQVQALSARLDTLAAIRQPMAATPPRSRQPTAASPAATQTPPYDPTKYTLGRLCPRGHDYQGTGQSLRRRHNGECAQCILVHRCDGPLVWTEHRGRAESFHSRLRHWHVCITLEETRRVVTAVPPAESKGRSCGYPKGIGSTMRLAEPGRGGRTPYPPYLPGMMAIVEILLRL
jgi:hypothetical protein